ncbi:hypothetical protein BJY01DRAFT_255277 [Aspergillus pseudoustus]|uniref:Uncharacterized protein n=1 Tax=Aspergillus pseudoustus TaxID=1810923 RepID=A0ABR4ILG8_9EURO
MENKSYPMLLNTESQLNIDFYLLGANDWIVLLEDPLVPPTANDSSVGGYAVASAIFMILDVTSKEALIVATGGTHNIQTTRTDGPCVMVTNGFDVETLRISACFTNLGAETITVAVNSSSDIQEPTMPWDSQAQKYITESSRRQLGASRARENLFSRGGYNTPWLFSMQLTNSLPAGVGTVGNTTTTVFRGVILSPNAFSGAMIAHLGHVNMFQDTLITTESPALALQVLLTRIAQMVYYEQLPKMDTKAAAGTAFPATASIPVQWTGFIIGMALTATHLIILIIVTIYFMSCTESRPILEQADNMTDQQLARWARHQSVDIKSRRMFRYQDNGRIALDATEDK